MEYRHELKYVITAAQQALLENRIQGLIKPDSHVGADGMYHIRSLYFDDYYNSYYKENEIGSDPREKFRIRIYNAGTGRISLELKRKEHGMTQKLSCRLTEEQCRELMAGRPLPMDPSYPPVLQKLNLQMRTRLLRPRIIVEYDRIPYVDPLGNTRITLDLNIRSSSYTSLFLTEQPPCGPLCRRGGIFWRSNTTSSCRITYTGICSLTAYSRRHIPNTTYADGTPSRGYRIKIKNS